MVSQIVKLPQRRQSSFWLLLLCAAERRTRQTAGAGEEKGYVRVRIDGNLYELTEEIKELEEVKWPS